MILFPGVYCTDGGPMSLSAGNLIFDGGPEDVWIIQVDEGIYIYVYIQMYIYIYIHIYVYIYI
jgi:hypothetical protein